MLLDNLRWNIKELLRARGLTQTALAEKMNLATGTVSNFLTGRNDQAIDIRQLDTLCDFLDVDVALLFVDRATMRSWVDDLETRGTESATPQRKGVDAVLPQRLATSLLKELEGYVTARLEAATPKGDSPVRSKTAHGPRRRKSR